MSSFIPIKGKTGECDPHRPPVPEAYYTKRETDALLATKVSFDQFNNHTLNTTVHITAEERAAWNNKITEPAEEGSAGDVLVTDGEGGRTWSASPTHTATWGQITGTLSNQTDLHTRLTTDETNISNEVTRATSAEGLLGQRITTETTRATNAESVLTSSIAAEVTRATTAETTLTTNLATEVTRATTAESTLQDNIDTEEARAEEAELIIQQNVESEATRAQGAETTLNSLITAEVTRAGVAETQLQSNITAEATTRAAADTTLQTNITNEVTRATGVEATKENVSNKVTEILSTSTHTEYASAKSVYDAISAIPKALVYKGTIGVGGTIQVLPEATEDRGGWTYKVITEAIYPPMTEKASIGDLIVCAWEEEPQPEGTYKWTLIPAGAEKVKDVQINGNSILSDAGVANIPYATSSSIGVVKGNTTYDVGVTNDGSICGYPRTLEQYGGTSNSAVIAKGTIENIKTDLTGRALADTSAPAYTTEQKEAALTRLGAEGKKFYKCTYGTTTAEEISTALTNNLVPYVYNNDIYYFYCGGTASDYYFTNLYGIEVITRTMYCACNKTSSTWTSNYKTLQQSQDRTDDVLTNKTDSTKYPSTKGVFNYAVGNVKVNGTALTKDENGDVNIPNAVTNSGGTGNVGLVRPNIAQGLYMATSTDIGVYPAEAGNINTRETSRPIVPTNLNYAVTAALTDSNKVVLTDTQKESAKNTIGVDTDINRIDNYIDGNLNGKTTNTEVANIKNLPTNVYSTTVNDIGGNSIVWNQYVDTDSCTSYTSYGVTFTVDTTDHCITIDGTATQKAMFSLNELQFTQKYLVAGHYYYAGGLPGTNTNVLFRIAGGYVDTSSAVITQCTEAWIQDPSTGIYIIVESGATVSNYKVYPKVFDLTLMFGAGNEPSTVAEFEAMFPNKYYPYSVPTVTHAAVDKVIYQGLNLFNPDDATTIGEYKAIRYDRPVAVRIDFKSGVTSVPAGTYIGVIYKNDGAPNYSATWFYANTAWSRRVCINGGSGYDKVLVGCAPVTALQYFDISVYENDYATESDVPPITPYYHKEVSVPTSVQQLEGYGWGVGNYYNEVNYSTKKYIKRVGTYTFTGNETAWLMYASSYIHNDGFDVAFYELDFVVSPNEVLCKSNYFVGYPSIASIWGGEGKTWRMCCNENHQLHFNIPHSETGTSSTSTIDECKAAFKTWLQAKATAGNPLTVYYVLSTPVETDITSLLTNTDIIKDTVTKNHITAQFNNTLQLPMYNSITSTSKKSVVNDVKINESSIVTDSVANIPIANATNTLGLIKVGTPNACGLSVNTSGQLFVESCANSQIDARNTGVRPIVPTNLDYAVKAALTDGVGAAYTTTEQAAARTRINAAEDKFFHCTYGTTTYQQISDAITAGKIPVCVYSVSSSETNDFFTYAGCTSTYHYFTAVATSGITIRYICVNTSNTWSSSSNSIENPYRLRECNPNYVGSTGVGSCNLVAFDVDNRLIQMTTGDTAATTKVPSTVPFRPDVLYYYVGGRKSEGATTDSSNIYSHIYTATVTYMFNEQVPAYHHVYLCGSYDKATGLFTLDNGQTNGVYNKYYKFVPETSGLVLSNYFETGKYYIKIGRSSTTTNTLQVSEEKPMYYFNGSALVSGKEDFHVMDATSFESLSVRSGYYFVY